ncbi:MAG: hypothetical protein PUP91_36680 [Rhizonema sp. PD37]|nr:hypothetical protein [Rhizonema sp. PD37]
MTSKKSKKSKVPKVNGIRMDINAPRVTGTPELVAICIPENKPGNAAPVELCVHITNNTSSSFPLMIYGGLIPELMTPDGQVTRPLEPINRQFGTQEHHWSLIRSGETIGMTLKAKLSWRNNSLQLEVPTNPDYYWEPPITPENSWTFDALSFGTYQLRFVYDNPSREIISSNPKTSPLTELVAIATDRLATSFINLRLVQSTECNKSAVEVNSIRFETLVPEQVLSLPKKEPGTKVSVQLAGIRITNNTPHPLCFSFYTTLIPEIVGVDGQILQRGYFSDWSRVAEDSDFVVVIPGKDVTLFPEATLWWQENDQLLLVNDAGDGGAYTFKLTDNGTYKIQINYVNKTGFSKIYEQETRNWKQIENIWMGMVTTPFVEFHLSIV